MFNFLCCTAAAASDKSTEIAGMGREKMPKAMADWQPGSLALEQAQKKGGDLVTTGVALGGELLDAARAQRADGTLLAKARGHGELLVCKGVAQVGEFVDAGKAREFATSGIARGAELVDGARAKADDVAAASDIITAGVARGGELVDGARAKVDELKGADWQKNAMLAKEAGGDLVTMGAAKGGELVSAAKSKAGAWKVPGLF